MKKEGVKTMTPEHNVISSIYSVKSRIECYLDEAADGWDSKGSGKFKEAEQILRWTHHEMERVLDMTKRFQEALKLPNGKEPGCCFMPIQDAIHESVASLRKDPSLNSSAATVDYLEYVPDDFPPLACDGEELKEILHHLLKNAYQALIEKKDGPRKVIVRVYTLWDFQAGKRPTGEIEIIDTGNGVPKDVLPYIFEPFYSTKPWGEGNGLGLWLVKRLVQKNEGQISVKTFEGCGTVFSVSFGIQNR